MKLIWAPNTSFPGFSAVKKVQISGNENTSANSHATVVLATNPTVRPRRRQWEPEAGSW
jgi:hypothetical protein